MSYEEFMSLLPLLKEPGRWREALIKPTGYPHSSTIKTFNGTPVLTWYTHWNDVPHLGSFMVEVRIGQFGHQVMNEHHPVYYKVNIDFHEFVPNGAVFDDITIHLKEFELDIPITRKDFNTFRRFFGTGKRVSPAFLAFIWREVDVCKTIDILKSI